MKFLPDVEYCVYEDSLWKTGLVNVLPELDVEYYVNSCFYLKLTLNIIYMRIVYENPGQVKFLPELDIGYCVYEDM